MTAHIYDAATGETIIRELTEEENAILELAKKEAKADAKTLANKKLARQAVLDKLGLTAEEAATLFG